MAKLTGTKKEVDKKESLKKATGTTVAPKKVAAKASVTKKAASKKAAPKAVAQTKTATTKSAPKKIDAAKARSKNDVQATKSAPAKRTAKKVDPSKSSSKNVTQTKSASPKAAQQKARTERTEPKRRLTEKEKEKLLQGFTAYQKKARDYVHDPSKLGPLAESAVRKIKDIPIGPFEDFWLYLMAMIRLIKAYYRNDYRKIPWQSMVLIVAAVVYFVAPIDLIPDWIPVIGYIDDAFVIGLVLKSVRGDLDAFMRWEAVR